MLTPTSRVCAEYAFLCEACGESGAVDEMVVFAWMKNKGEIPAIEELARAGMPVTFTVREEE